MEDRLEMVGVWKVVVAGGSRHVELELRAFKSPAQREIEEHERKERECPRIRIRAGGRGRIWGVAGPGEGGVRCQVGGWAVVVVWEVEIWKRR